MNGPRDPRTRRASTALVAVLLFALAACAGAGNAGSGAPGRSGGGGGAGTTNQPDPAAGASCGNPAGASIDAAGGALASMLSNVLCGMANIDPCSMLTQTDVQALFSVPLAAYTTDHFGGCTWPLSDPNKGDGLDVSVNTGGDNAIENDIDFTKATPMTGVGDRAVWELLAGYFPHVGAIKGGASCELTIGGGNGQVSAPVTGQGVFAAIDSNALPGFMAKFGALCNQIFTGLGSATAGTIAMPSAGGATPAGTTAATVTGHLGDKLTFAEFGSGDQVDATLVKIFDPATPSDSATSALPAGARWVGVEVIIDNHSSDYNGQLSQVDGVTSDGSTVTTDDVYQSYSRPIGTFTGCTQTPESEQDVQLYTHCEAFVVPDGQSLVKVGVKVGGAEIGSSLVPADQATWTVP